MKKKTAFNDFLRQFNINPNQVLYMGDDVPDLPVMELAGVSTCPSDSATDVKQFADYVSHKKGGDGCVREIIEQVLRVQGKWDFGVKNKY
jgi:3-deoxy-D-manno-octulosonate 8-phosphate phosphatase (KDO 8-P phosphatase)